MDPLSFSDFIHFEHAKTKSGKDGHSRQIPISNAAILKEMSVALFSRIVNEQLHHATPKPEQNRTLHHGLETLPYSAYSHRCPTEQVRPGLGEEQPNAEFEKIWKGKEVLLLFSMSIGGQVRHGSSRRRMNVQSGFLTKIGENIGATMNYLNESIS